MSRYRIYVGLVVIGAYIATSLFVGALLRERIGTNVSLGFLIVAFAAVAVNQIAKDRR